MEQSVNQRIGAYVKFLKKERKISQKKLCTAIKIPETTLSGIINDAIKDPKWTVFSKLLQYDPTLNPYWLLAIMEKPMFLTETENKISEVAKLAEKMEEGIDLDTLLPPETDDKTLIRHMMGLIQDIQKRMEKAGI